MKRVLVTGCAGYLGSVLSSRLLSVGYEVWGIDNLSFSQEIPICMQKCMHDRRAIFIKQDITDSSKLREAVLHIDPYAVIHLAAVVGMPLCKKEPEKAIMVNTESTRVLLQCLNSDVKFVMPNTNSQYGTVYGDVLCTEETPTNPISLYSVTKCIAESLVLNRPNSVCLRLATIYGISPTRMRDDLLVNFYTKTLTQKGHIDIFEPDYKRNFLHIEDVSKAFIHAIEADLDGVYNVGDDKLNTTKGQLAQNIADIVGGTVGIIDGEDPDKRNYNCSSQKLYNTGYNIETDFREEILKLADYYRINDCFTNTV